MKFPIDVVFLDSSNKVIDAVCALAPYRISRLHLSAHSILELPAGTVKKSHTEVGDQLEVSLAESSAMDDLKDTQLTKIS
jgi:hypothetical protein